jgi:hypothetical protein
MTVWRDVVGTADDGHFRHEDGEMLGLYCVQIARRDAADIEGHSEAVEHGQPRRLSTGQALADGGASLPHHCGVELFFLRFDFL